MQQIDNIIAHIDLSALVHNAKTIKKRVPNCRILAMVKSNAYGHGALEVAKALEPEVDAFAVASLNEALLLKENGTKKPIVILGGFFTQEELEVIAEHNFETVIHNHEQLMLLEKAKLKNKISVWLKIDTGMHRLGFSKVEFKAAYQKIFENQNVRKPIKLMTHFSDADDLSKNKTALQLESFIEATSGLEGEKSFANSATILCWSKTGLRRGTLHVPNIDWVRPGILLYGVSPLPQKTGVELGFKPGMTLTSRLIAVHALKRGDTVGYGSNWTCPESMRVGIVAIGYSGGYMRAIKTGAPVLINGKVCPVIGTISMEMTNVDLRACPQTKVGDEVILWGNGLPVETIATYANTIPYELLVRVTPTKYRFIKGSRLEL